MATWEQAWAAMQGVYGATARRPLWEKEDPDEYRRVGTFGEGCRVYVIERDEAVGVYDPTPDDLMTAERVHRAMLAAAE